MTTFRDLQRGLQGLGLDHDSRVLVHANPAALGALRGGVDTLAGALTTLCGLVLAPAFTYQCLVWPRIGPPDNALDYAAAAEHSAEAQFFHLDLPAHPDLGPLPERLRRLPGARRSAHPLLSFVAVGDGAETVTAAQTVAEPLGPVAALAGQAGDVLLLGVSHTSNVALHYAERRAGRRQFIRWALTPRGVVECPAWPGCPDGFDQIAPRIAPLGRSIQIGPGLAQRFPLRPLLQAAQDLLRADPLALLCSSPTCERCAAVRASASSMV